jgi:hypothetical protein
MEIKKILNKLEGSINGSLDGFEFDNTTNVIEKSLVTTILSELKSYVTQAQVSLEKKDYLTFGEATEAAKKGKRIARRGWNGQGMFAYIVPSASYPAQTDAAKKFFGEKGLVPYQAYWALMAPKEAVATWAPSGSDSLAEDWMILD